MNYYDILFARKIAGGGQGYFLKNMPNTPTDIVTMRDAAPLTIPSLKIAITPIQAGSGDSSPTNARTISAWGAAEIRKTGANLWGGEDFKNDFLRAVSDAAGNTEDKYIYFTAGATASGLTYQHIKFKENTQYTLVLTGYNSSPSSRSTNLRVYYTNGTSENLFFGSTEATKQTAVITTAANKTVRHITKYTAVGTTFLYYDECGLFEGILTAQNFVAYQGEVKNIPFKDGESNPITIPQGRIEINNGKVQAVSDHKMFSFTATDKNNWSVDNSGFFRRSTPSGFPATYPDSWRKGYLSNVLVTAECSGSAANVKNNSFYAEPAYLTVRIDDFNSDLATFQDMLTNTGLQILAPMDEITYDLEDISLTSLDVLTDIWANCGQILQGEYIAKN